MVRPGVLFFILMISSALLILSVNAGAQGKPEKEKIRIGYAARAVTHAIPYLANEARLFRDEGLQVEVVRTAGAVSPMALIFRRYRFRYDVGFLVNSGVRSEPGGCDARRVDPL